MLRKPSNNMHILRTLLFAVICMPLALCEANGGSSDREAAVAHLLENFRTVTPETLRDPKNADLIECLRQRAKTDDVSRARVLLLRLGDEATLKTTIDQLHADRPNLAARALIKSGNPKIISLLAEDFDRIEDRAFITKGDGPLHYTVGMRAASIARQIILDSPAFTPQVKEWAKALPELSLQMQISIRQWWHANKAALLQEQYQTASPL
jgi:hypothetical protein